MREQILRVRQLEQRLFSLGYRPFQVDNIIWETVETRNIESLNGEQVGNLIEALEDYVKFAEKSIQSQL